MHRLDQYRSEYLKKSITILKIDTNYKRIEEGEQPIL